MEESVKTIQKQASETKISVKEKEEEMEPIRKAIDESQEKLSKCHRPQDLKDSIRKTKAKIQISQYQALKERTDAAEAALTVAQTNLKNHEDTLQRKKDRVPEEKNNLELLKARREELTPAMQESQQILDTIKPRMKQLRDVTQTAKAKLENAKVELGEKKRNLRLFEDQLQRSKQRQDLEEYDHKKADLENEIKQLSDNIDQWKADRKMLSDQRIVIKAELGKEKNALDENIGAATTLQRQITELDRDIHSFSTSANDSWGILKIMDGCAESNVKSLSGGERSFTMVSFLLALWQLVQIPFRVLDEFDVFMDMLNRDHAMVRLIDASINSGRQFIFLTPLSFSQSVLETFKEHVQVEMIRMPTVSRQPILYPETYD